MLEEGSFRGRTADFVFMFLFGGFLMTVSFNKWNKHRKMLTPSLFLKFFIYLPQFTGYPEQTDLQI